jgi:hypothetical protein
VVEKVPQSLLSAREKMIQWYADKKAWEQAILYLDKIQFSIQDNSFDEALTAEILGVYLFSDELEKTMQVVQNVLIKKDITESSPIYSKLNVYLSDETIPEKPKKLIFAELLTINVKKRPDWQKFIATWSPLYGPPSLLEATFEQYSGSDD